MSDKENSLNMSSNYESLSEYRVIKSYSVHNGNGRDISESMVVPDKIILTEESPRFKSPGCRGGDAASFLFNKSMFDNENDFAEEFYDEHTRSNSTQSELMNVNGGIGVNPFPSFAANSVSGRSTPSVCSMKSGRSVSEGLPNAYLGTQNDEEALNDMMKVPESLTVDSLSKSSYYEPKERTSMSSSSIHVTTREQKKSSDGTIDCLEEEIYDLNSHIEIRENLINSLSTALEKERNNRWYLQILVGVMFVNHLIFNMVRK
eukprot:Nk52_evm57s2039 gene=Nk52_evmTU57s2039